MSQYPYVEYKHLEPRPFGGTRGKMEYRRHVSVDRIVGSDGRNTIFEGHCPECGFEYFGKRLEKRKNLLKCPECDFTAFVSKGFFNHNQRDYEIEPPSPDEYAVPLYKVKLQYSEDLEPNWFYGSEEYIDEKINSEYWTVVAPKRRVEDA